MNQKEPVTNSLKKTGNSPKQQDFLTYKDFNSDKSLGSEDFNESFGIVNNSFYSSENDDQADSILEGLKQKEIGVVGNKVKNKEEETNYTAKVGLILDKEDIKKTAWCGNCVFNSGQGSGCLTF